MGLLGELIDIELLLNAQATGQAAFGEVESGLGGVGTAAAAMAAALVLVGAAVAAISVKMAADFQQSITQLQTGAGEIHSNLAMVSAGILNMAGEVGVSAQDLSKAMFMIESAGYHGAAGLTILKVAAEGAVVGGADLETTANAVTTVMSDYHMSVNQAADATNFLVAVVKQGKTHMQDLAGAIANVLPMAAALKIPLQDVGGALATMTSKGISADQAATYLRFTMSSLAAETPKGAKALQDIGLTSQEVADTMNKKGLVATFELLEEHLHKKFPQGGAAYFAALKEITGGTRGLGAALQLSGENLSTFEQDTKNVADAIKNGHGQVIGWDEAQKDLTVQFNKAKDALGSVAIELGLHLLPYVSQFLGAVTPLIGMLGTFVNQLFQSNSAASGLAQGVQGVGGGLNQLGVAFGGSKEVAKLWGEAVKTFGPILADVKKAVNEFMLEHKADFKEIGETTKQIMALIGPLIEATLKAIQKFWHDHGEQIMAIVKAVFNVILGVINTVMHLIADIIKLITDIIKGDWGAVWQDILKLLQDAILGIINLVLNLYTLWKKAWDFLITEAKDLAVNLIDGIVGVILAADEQIAEAVIGAVKGGLNAAKNFLGIHSPSTMTADLIGKPMAQGIGVGIADNMSGVGAAMSTVPLGGGGSLAGGGALTGGGGSVVIDLRGSYVMSDRDMEVFAQKLLPVLGRAAVQAGIKFRV